MPRLLDIVLAIVGLVVAMPLILLSALAIRLESRGPAIFAQVRAGRREQPFTCYELRSMAQGTREGASHEVGAASITRVGAFLRRTKLDELPQLWNVLRGEMSLVEPRPCLPTQAELIAARQALGVDALRPGITGPGQVAGLDMSDPQRLAAADSAWLQGATLRRYIAILAATVFGSSQGDAAARRQA